MPKKATHILNNNNPASFDELQTLLRPVERGGGGWLPDLEVRPFVYGTEEIKIVHLVKPEEEDEDLGIVFTVSVDHGPEAQKPWYDRGYRILSKTDSYAKNVVMTLVKKPKPKTPDEPSFREPCRFGGFCTEKELYEDCIKDKRMKNNWMCWRDGILERENEPRPIEKTFPETSVKPSVPPAVREHEAILKKMKREKKTASEPVEL